MNDKKFVKDLSNEEQAEILNFILEKFELENNFNSKAFFIVMVNYIKTVRRNLDTFERNVSEVIDLFKNCGYDNDEIIRILTKEPSLLHSNKDDIFWRLLILGKVKDTKRNMGVRNYYLVENPRILRTSQEYMYARVKYLLSDLARKYLRNLDSGITVRQVSKITHDEFEKTYGISKEQLLKMFPFDNQAQLDVIFFPRNNEILNNVYGRRVR